MNQKTRTAELQLLTAQMLAGELTDEQNERLVELLNESPEAIDEYVKQVHLDSLLTSTLIESVPREQERTTSRQKELELPGKKQATVSKFKTGIYKPATVATAVLLMIGSIFFFTLGWQKNNENPISVDDEIAGILLDTEDVVWGQAESFSNDVEIPYGKKFSRGKILEIESGIARLRFQCGAGIVLEGPAKIELQSPLKALLHFGKLAAYVPDGAQGFTVTTSDLKIVDLGTRFGAMVNPSGEAEVHVFEGEVDVQPLAEKAKQSNLKANETLHFSAGKVVRNGFEISPEKFADVPTLEQLTAARSGVYPPQHDFLHDRKQSDILFDKETPPQTSFPQGVIMGELFSYASHNLHGQTGGIGFHPSGWWADQSFSRLVKPAKAMTWGNIDADGLALSMNGRHHAFPALVHRIARKFETALESDFYFSFLFRYQGVDQDDFVGFWLDKTIGGKGSSHSRVPNIGVKNGKLFARLDVEHEVYAEEPVNENVYFLVGKLYKDNSNKYNRLAMWINPVNDLETDPDLTAHHTTAIPLESINAIGIRIGQYTEVTDELLLDRLLIGESYESVTRPLSLASPNDNDDRVIRAER